MPSSRGRWALPQGHVAIHSLVQCCCRISFPAHPTLIPAPWHYCADPPALGTAMVPPSPTDHVQKGVGYGWLGTLQATGEQGPLQGLSGS